MMIIAIALQNNELNSAVCAQFGRSPWFAIYDGGTGSVRYIKNDGHDAIKDAGVSAASMLMTEGVSLIVAGRFGLKAEAYLQEQGVQMVVPFEDKVTLKCLIRKINPAEIRNI